VKQKEPSGLTSVSFGLATVVFFTARFVFSYLTSREGEAIQGERDTEGPRHDTPHS
jgi:hypothetical protein